MPKTLDEFTTIMLKTGPGFRKPAAAAALVAGDIANAIIAATPGGIEAQEKAGQTALVNSTNMPIEMSPDRAAFEKVGFVFGDAVDELFCEATLPAGWTRAATDHSMHSTILDEQGRERVSIFYKAAFYDRRADAQLIRRYKIQERYGDSEYSSMPDLAKDKNRYLAVDIDKEINRSLDFGDRDWTAKEIARTAISNWFDKNFPEWKDPTAYWDQP